MNRQARRSWCEIAERYDGLTVRFGCSDAGTFRLVVDELKDAIPARYRSWDPVAKSWWVSGIYEDELRDWAAEWFDAQGARDSRPPPSAPAAHPHGDAYRALHLLPTAPPELVKAAYRTLALLNHPDRGGSTSTMQQINGAYEVLVRSAA